MTGHPPLCIVAGMPRAATTFLYHVLAEHPLVFAPFRKETNFFLTNHVRGMDWYLGLYADRAPGQVCLDVSPAYYEDPASAERIQAYPGPRKAILAVRDPAEQAVSWYAQQLTHYSGFMGFQEFLTRWTVRRGDGEVTLELASGHFQGAMAAFRASLGPDLLLYDYAFFRREPLQVLQAVEAFLGLDRHFTPATFTNRVVNASSRLNFRPLTYLLSREAVISAIEALVPRRLVLALRRGFDRLSAPRPRQPVAGPRDQARLDLARARLGADEAAYRALFADGPVLLGDGARVELQPGPEKGHGVAEKG
ncbi:MAG: sulfotransferase domain-containing protein [Thermodesulfobacteriota bacterium]